MKHFYLKINTQKLIILLGLLLLLLTGSMLKIGFLFIMTIGGLIILIMPIREHLRSSHIRKLIAAVFFVLLAVLVKTESVSFTFMPQAKVLLDHSTNLLYWFKTGNIHAIRLLIAYPGYLISRFFSVNLDKGYSYYCAVIFLLLYLFLIKTEALYVLRQPVENSISIHDVVTFCFCMFLTIVMNGRVIFAFFGFAIILEQMTKFMRLANRDWFKRLCLICIAWVFTMVSSGTMVVTLGYVLSVIVVHTFKHMKFKFKTALRLLIICIIGFSVIYRLTSYVLQMINKNISFFGGITNMLQHGMGKLFPKPGPSEVVFFGIGAILILLLNILLIRVLASAKYQMMPLWLAVNISLYGLLFGFSAGSLMLIPLCVWSVKIISSGIGRLPLIHKKHMEIDRRTI